MKGIGRDCRGPSLPPVRVQLQVPNMYPPVCVLYFGHLGGSHATSSEPINVCVEGLSRVLSSLLHSNHRTSHLHPLS